MAPCSQPRLSQIASKSLGGFAQGAGLGQHPDRLLLSPAQHLRPPVGGHQALQIAGCVFDHRLSDT